MREIIGRVRRRGVKIDIIGAGSLGLLLAGKLIGAGAEVRLWCRSDEQSRALEENGITISYEDGQPPVFLPPDKFKSASVNTFAEVYLHDPGDWMAIMVKQNALHNEFPQILLPLKQSKIQAVCFQNGYGHLELLQELLPQAAVWAAVTTEAAKRKTLTEVVHAGRGEICIGKVGDSNTTHGPSSLISFIETLTAAGFSASMSKEVDTMIYRKLLINAVINPLTAIWRVPNGELLAAEQRIHLMKELYEEAIAVYEACGIALESNAWEGIMEVCRATAGNISSMLADVLSSRATEIRWINGSIVDMAERSGIDAPQHRWICRMVEGMLVRER